MSGHHYLEAIGIETGTVEREAAVEAERKKKPRRKSVKALIETAKRAGLAVTALKPDGSVDIGEKIEREPDTINCNPWDEVLHHGDN